MRQFGLIGYPLGHSFSKGYFAEKFLRGGIDDARYDNFELTDIAQFPNLVQSHPNLAGLNVTIPYKQAIIPYLDGLDAAAKLIGAVNTIKFTDGKMLGYNTDYIGFLDSIKPLLQPHHIKALILGTGGSSKAVEYALGLLGIQHRYVSREPVDGQLGYDQLTEAVIQEYTVVVNTTPLGMHPNVDACPDIPYQYLTPRHLLCDLVYNPTETQFLAKGKLAGAATKNGLHMLELQAEAAWSIWNGNG